MAIFDRFVGKRLVAFVAMLVLLSMKLTTALGAPITYAMHFDGGGGNTLDGTITTDGTIGEIFYHNIGSRSFVASGTPSFSMFETGCIFCTGLFTTSLIATESVLKFNVGTRFGVSSSIGSYGMQSNPEPPFVSVVDFTVAVLCDFRCGSPKLRPYVSWASSEGGSFASVQLPLLPENTSDDYQGATPVIGLRVSPIPIPSCMPLTVLAFAGLVGLTNRRSRRNEQSNMWARQ